MTVGTRRLTHKLLQSSSSMWGLANACACAAQDDGSGHQEIVPSLLTGDTLNPSFYGIRIIAREAAGAVEQLLRAGQGGETQEQHAGLWRGRRPGGAAKSGTKPRPASSAGGKSAARKQRAGRRKRSRERRKRDGGPASRQKSKKLSLSGA